MELSKISISAVILGGGGAIFGLMLLVDREASPAQGSSDPIRVVAGRSAVSRVTSSSLGPEPLVVDAKIGQRDQRARAMEASFKQDYTFIDTVRVVCDGEKCAIKGMLKPLSTAEAYDDFTSLIDNNIKSKMAANGFVAIDNVVIDTTGDAFTGFHADLVAR